MDGQQLNYVIGDESHVAVTGNHGYNGSGGIIAQAGEALQKDLDSLMDVLEEVKDKIPEGEYLRGMNALGSLHKHKRTTLAGMRPGAILRCWKTLDEIEEDDAVLAARALMDHGECFLVLNQQRHEASCDLRVSGDLVERHAAR